MKEFLGIMFCLISGLITYSSILFLSNGKKSKNESFITSLSIVFLILLTFFQLLPMIVRILNNRFIVTQSYAFIFLLSLISFVIVKVLKTYFNKEDINIKKETNIILFIAFFLFFLIEGFNLYSVTIISIKEGIVLLLKYLIYNILIGIIYSNYFEKPDNKKFVKSIIYLIFSIFIAGLITFIFDIVFEKNFIIGCLSSITFGIFIYIILFILYPNFKNVGDRKSKVLGLLLGGVIFALTTLF